jgi:hypothetical protein
MVTKSFDTFRYEYPDPIEKTSSPEGTKRFQIFSWIFTWHGENNLQWKQPSNLVIYSDSSWYIYARHLANMRRTKAIWDFGNHRTFLVAVIYYDKDKKVIGASDYVLWGLDYKKEIWNKDSRGSDEFVKAREPEIQFASCAQWIR